MVKIEILSDDVIFSHDIVSAIASINEEDALVSPDEFYGFVKILTVRWGKYSKYRIDYDLLNIRLYKKESFPFDTINPNKYKHILTVSFGK